MNPIRQIELDSDRSETQKKHETNEQFQIVNETHDK